MGKLLIIFLFAFTLLFSQDSTNNIQSFNKAIKLYDAEKYDEAFVLFQSLSIQKSLSYSIPARIFIGKILMRQDKLDEADKLFLELKSTVKDTSFKKEILLSRGVLLYTQNKFYESAEELLELIASIKDSKYTEYTRKALDTIAVYKLTTEQLNVLYDISRKEVKPLILLLNGKNLIAQGRKNDGRSVLQKLIKQYPSSPERKDAEEYYYERKTVIKMKEGEPVITILFPQSEGQANKAIEEITEGIKFAVYEFNSSRSEKIGLVFIDFKKENIRQIKENILNSNTKGIVGPIFSDDVRLTLNEFRGIKLPILSPTATDNDLIEYSSYFFQANPNFDVRAKAMAQYIFYVENKRRMSVLNGIDGYSPLLASSFIKEFRHLGGEIVVQQTYKGSSGINDEQLQTFTKAVDIEGVYVPVSDREDVTVVLTALSRNNISLPLYGNQDWFIGRGYESYPIVNNIVFTSDYFIDYNSFGYTQFNENFQKITKKEAERNVLYGYDLMKYFLNQITKINAGPEIIADRMMNGNTVMGYHNNICFDEERVNKYINIVRYRDGIFELVDKFKTSK